MLTATNWAELLYPFPRILLKETTAGLIRSP